MGQQIESTNKSNYDAESFLNEYTVQTFNSCTKYVGNPGVSHDGTPDYHSVSWS